ncbi:MAG: ArsR family transcriptional regulator [Burkholderia gladioli]
MNATYAQAVVADRRLMILCALAETLGYGANASLLQTLLDSVGHVMSADQVTAELVWLAEVGLVTLKDQAAILSARGGEVAAGRAAVPGVRRLRPGE